MFATKMYKVKENNIIKITGSVSDKAKVLETLDILNAEEGHTLIRIDDNENIGNSVWLKDTDKIENYKEIEDEGIN